MTVYVPSKPKEDISAAAEYGPLEFINQYHVHADELDGENLPLDVWRRINRAVGKFDPERDYMVIVGDHLIIAALSGALKQQCGSFRVLRWDRQARGYYVVRI